MKTLYTSILLLLCACFYSCQTEVENEHTFTTPNIGGLNFQTFAVDTTDIPIIMTKAPDFGVLNKEDFIVRFYTHDGSEYTGGITNSEIDGSQSTNKYSGKTLRRLREMGMPLLFPIGEYTMKAFSYDSIAVLVDKPYFMGETTFTIEEHVVNDATVVCRYQSVGAEVRLSDDFLSFFKDNYKIIISNGLGSSQTFDKDNQSIFYFTENCDYLKVVVECETKDNLIYNPRTYYFNGKGEDPQFENDGPRRGQHFIIGINAAGKLTVNE